MKQDMDWLMESGHMWEYLKKRRAADVLFAYEGVFGGVQGLAAEYDLLSTIMLKLMNAGTDERHRFWGFLERRGPHS